MYTHWKLLIFERDLPKKMVQFRTFIYCLFFQHQVITAISFQPWKCHCLLILLRCQFFKMNDDKFELFSAYSIFSKWQYPVKIRWEWDIFWIYRFQSHEGTLTMIISYSFSQFTIIWNFCSKISRSYWIHKRNIYSLETVFLYFSAECYENIITICCRLVRLLEYPSQILCSYEKIKFYDHWSKILNHRNSAHQQLKFLTPQPRKSNDQEIFEQFAITVMWTKASL